MRVVVWGVLLVACSDEGHSHGFEAPDAGSADASGLRLDSGPPSGCSGEGCGGRADASGAATGGRSGNATGGGGGGGTAGEAGGDGCTTDVFALERVPLDIHVLLDTSASMGENVSAGTKWDIVSGSLVAYLQDQEGTGMGVGLTYFPTVLPGAPGASCQTDLDCVTPAGNFGTCEGLMLGPGNCLCSCTLADVCGVPNYTTPAVPITVLGDSTPLLASIQGRSPSGNTPTRPALEGTLAYASQWTAAHPERNVVVVLATDGEPFGCTLSSVQDVANVAAAGFASGIPTFAIGVGSSLTSLNSVASAGGTGQAYLIDTAADVGQAFTEALNEIRDLSSSCSFPLPAEAANELAFVNVRVAASSAAARIIPQVATAAECGSIEAWYYDEPGAPTTVHLCPASCASPGTADNLEAAVSCTPTVQVP